jgi:hypothetical protein
MKDRSLRGETSTEVDAGVAGRRSWSSPRMRTLKMSAAESGPNFPTADGIEGQS